LGAKERAVIFNVEALI